MSHFFESDRYLVGEMRTRDPVSINAEVHSDDYAIEVSFDAAQWFRMADDEAIVALAGCEWRGDYPADRVARESAVWFPEIGKVFDHRNGNEDLSGFECSVDRESATAWLTVNRPWLLEKIGGDFE